MKELISGCFLLVWKSHSSQNFLGSIFQLSEGADNFALALAITVLGLPGCFFLFYAAIKKGIAETEADDAEFNIKNRQF